MSGLLGTFADQRVDWKPGSHDLVWDRTITAVDSAAKTIEIDAPVTFLIEKSTGGGTVAVVESNPPLQNIGIEDLSLESAYDSDNPKDEEHAWIAIALDHVRTPGSATSPRGTSSAPPYAPICAPAASPCRIAAAKRPSPKRAAIVVNRFSSRAADPDLSLPQRKGDERLRRGLLAGGPNVFLDCDAMARSEPAALSKDWASGVLYERVHVPDSRIQLLLDQTRAQAAGWTAANSLIWNSTAKSLDAIGPSRRIELRRRISSAPLRGRTERTRPASSTSTTPRLSNEQAP